MIWFRRAPGRLLALWGSLLLAACSVSNRTPEGAVRLFVEAARSADNEDLFALLAPESQKQLHELAEVATAQTGGRHQFKPQEMLVIGMEPPLHKLGDSWEAEVIREEQARAEVRITSADKRHQHTFRLVRADGGWRVLLPREALAPLPGTDASRSPEKPAP